MHWILQENIYNEPGWEQLKWILEKSEIPHSVHKVVPFGGGIEPDIYVDGPVMCIGSYGLRHTAKEKGWTPGVFDLEDFGFEVCRKNWGRAMLNFDAYRTELGFLPMMISPGEIYFARPDGDNKYFAGGVKSYDDLIDIVNNVKNLKDDEIYYGLNMSTDVIISPIIEIYAEYRTWIVDGKVVTASLYKRGGRVLYQDDVDQRIIQFAQFCVDVWQPDRAFVLDIAETENGLRIIETNTINAAGFYAANINKLVNAIENMGY